MANVSTPVMTSNVLIDTPRGPLAISLNDKLLDQRCIFLTDGVNTQTMTELIKQVKYLDSREGDGGEEITLYINSPGGGVISGLALYDVLVSAKSPIRTVCIGDAASMGAILFLAGEKREMLPHTRLMIHDPSFGNLDVAGMKPHELRHEVESLERTKDILAEIIAEKTGKPLEEITKTTANDSYFTAEEAIEFGLATDICKGV